MILHGDNDVLFYWLLRQEDNTSLGSIALHQCILDALLCLHNAHITKVKKMEALHTSYNMINATHVKIVRFHPSRYLDSPGYSLA